MIAAGALLLGAVLVDWLAPMPLSRLALRVRPGVGLTWWLALTVAAFASAAAGSVLLLLGDHPHVDDGLWEMCSALLGHRHVHPTDEIAGLLLLALLCAAAAKAARLTRRRVAAQRRSHRAHLLALASAAVSDVDGVLWLEHDAPFAYSISGRPGLVVASTGLNRLPERQRDAVLRHERHHLRHRHHWLVLATSAVTDALPRVPLFRAAARATRALTESAADDRAARDLGPDAVVGALLAMGQTDRVAALRQRPPRPSWRAAAHVVALATSGVAPAIVGATVLTAIIMVAC